MLTPLPARRTVTITPATWFEARVLVGYDTDEPAVEFVDDPVGAWAAVPLADFRALHFTFGAWRAAADARPPARKALDEVLTASRRRLQSLAEGVLAGSGPADQHVRLSFPPLTHSSLRTDRDALDLLRQFLSVGRSPSLAAWVVAQARTSAAIDACAARPWLRLVFQQVAVETRDAAVLAVVRELYGQDEAMRVARLAEEAALVATSGLQTLGTWATTLGLTRPARVLPPWGTPSRRPAPARGAPDVTVLVPSYRHGAFIDAAIESVLAQTHASLAVHVVDDCSPDDTAARARGIDDPRVTVSVNERRLGLGDSVLAALDDIDTPFVALLNSDDLFAPDRLAICLARFAADSRTQVVATGLTPVDAGGAVLTVDTVRPAIDGYAIADWLAWFADRGHMAPDESLTAALLERNFLVTSSNIVCRTSYLRAIAPRLRGLQFCLDWQIVLEAALDDALVVDAAPALAYRLHGSNTVWFDEARAVAYRLEVNRVLASALARLRPPADADTAAMTGFLDAVAHAAKHPEARGPAMAAAAIAGGEALESALLASSAVAQSVTTLAAPTSPMVSSADRELASRLLAELAREEVAIATGGAASDRRALSEVVADRDAQAREAAVLRARVDAETAAHASAISRLQADIERDSAARRAESAAHAAEVAARTAEMADLQRQFEEETVSGAAARSELRAELQRAVARHASERDAFAAEIATVRAEADSARATARETSAALSEVGARLSAAETAWHDDRRRLAAVETAWHDDRRRLAAAETAWHDDRQRLAVASTQLGEAAQHITQMTADHAAALEKAAADAAAQTQAAVAQLRSAPEWLLGDRLWNRLKLARIGVPVVRGWHESRDRRNRASLAARGLARRLGLAKPGAVVAACWSFPIHSQTFVYQEMSALSWAGLDYRVFCCDTNPRSELPSAFAGLWDKRLVMQTDWDRGQQDLAHFRRTCPDRVAALLTTLARATGRTEEALLQESIVLTGFTFARHLELNGTRYVHTYFFYDQSFLGLMAAYLLEIPRGITAYADHMLGDYPFKLVPLHLELADIVVATSARIKQELGDIGGGRFDDKIVVKPNGIDASRFSYIPAAERLAIPGVPEIVAVNRIEPKKGLIHLVDAMARLRDRGLAARANIVGGVDANTPTSAACHRELVDRIAALGLQDAVILHGVKQQHEFAPIAARSRLFVAPYVEVGSGDKDGIPTAVLEAMSTGLPIVATDAGSIVEASRPDVEALIVPQRDPDALADAIARLLTDRETYVRLSDAARARAVSEFDISVTEVRLHERIARAMADRR